MFLLLHPSTYCRAVAAMLQRRLLHRVTNRVIPLTPYTRNFTCGVIKSEEYTDGFFEEYDQNSFSNTQELRLPVRPDIDPDLYQEGLVSVVGVTVSCGSLAYVRLLSDSNDRKFWNVTHLGLTPVENKNPRLHPIKLQNQAEVALENVPEGTCYVMDSSEHKYLSRPGETEIAIGLQMAQLRGMVQGLLADRSSSVIKLYFVRESHTKNLFNTKIGRGTFFSLSLCSNLLRGSVVATVPRLYTPPSLQQTFDTIAQERRSIIAPAIYASLAFCAQLSAKASL